MADQIKFRFSLEGANQVTQGANAAAASLDKLGAAGGNASAGLQKSGSALGSLATGAKTLAGLAIVNELTQAAKAAIGTADAVTSLQNSLQLATGSAAAAGQAYNALFDIAQRSRTGFLELGGTYASIARATDSLGISQQRLLKVTEAIGNALAVGGGSAQAMQAALTQLGQGLASGKLAGDELRSILEQTPRLARAIADGMGVTVGKLRELGQEGKITAETVIGALENQSETLAREMGGAVITVSQAWTQLGNSATKAIGQLDQATGTTGAIAAGLQVLSHGIDDVADRFQRARDAGHGFFGSVAVAQILGTAEALGYVDQQAANLPRRLTDAEKELAKLQERFSQRGGFYLATEVEKAGELVKKLREAKEAQDDLKAERGTSQSSQFGEASAAIQALATKGLEAQKKATEALTAARNQALGVNASWLKSINELYAAFQAGHITEKQYTETVKSLTSETYKAAAAHKAHEAAMDSATKKFFELTKAGHEWARGLEVNNATLAREAELGRQLTEGEKQQIELTTKLATGQLVMNAATEKGARAAIDYGQALRTHVDWQRQSATENEKSFDKLQDETAALEQRVLAMRAGNDQQLVAASAVRQVEAAQLRAAAAEKERRAVVMDLVDPAIAQEYRKQAAALREQAAESGRAANIEAAKDSAAAWQAVANDAGQALANALMDGGKSAGEYLKGYFRTLFGRELAGLFSSAIGAFGQSVGLSAGGGYAGALGQLGGGAGTPQGNTLNTLYGAYNVAAGYLGFGGATAGAATGTLAYANAVGALGGDSLGALYMANNGWAGVAAGNSLGSAAAGEGVAAGSGAAAGSSAATAIPIIGWIIAAYLASSSAYKAGYNDTLLDDKANAATPGGSISLTHLKAFKALGISDKWANILSARPLVARLLGHKPSVSGFGIGSIQGGDFIQETQAPFEFGRNIVGGGVDEGLQDLASRLAGSVSLSASLFGGGLTPGLRVGALTDRDRENEVAALLGFFRQDNSLVAGTQTGSGAFGSGGPGQAASKIASDKLEGWVAEQMPVLIIQGLQQSDLEDRFDEFFRSIDAGKIDPEAAQKALQTASAIADLTKTFDPLGGVLSQFSELSVATFDKLATASGGFDALGQKLGVYYQSYYSEAEQASNATRQVSDALAALGLQMPDIGQGADAAKSQLRALIDAQDLKTESGLRAFNTLIDISGAFDQLATASDAAAAKLRQEADARLQSAQQLIDQNIGKFVGAADVQRYRYGQVAQNLASAGFNFSTEQLMGTSKADILAFVNAVVSLGDGASEAELAVLKAAGALADLKDEAATAAKAAADAASQAAQAAAQQQAELLGMFQAAQQDALAGVVAAYSQVQQQVDAERQRIQSETDQAIQAAGQKADAGIRQLETQASSIERIFGGMLDSFGDGIARLTGDLAGDGGRGGALRTLRAGLAALQTGGTVDADALRSATGLASQVNPAGFASRLDYQRELASTATLLRDLSGAARGSMTTQLGAIAAQQVDIEKGLADQTKALKDTAAGQLSKLEDQLRTARGQAESLVRIDDGVQTVAQALAALASAVSAAGALQGKPSQVTGQWQQSGSTQVWQSSGGAVGTLPVGSTDPTQLIIKGRQSVFNAGEARTWITSMLIDGREADIITRAIAEGIDSQSLDALTERPAGTWLAEAKKRGLPAFATGTAYVPQTGVALIHEGERILPAADNAALMRALTDSSGGSRDDLVAEVRELRRVVEKAADFQFQALPVIATNTRKTQQHLDAVVFGKVPIRTKVVAAD